MIQTNLRYRNANGEYCIVKNVSEVETSAEILFKLQVVFLNGQYDLFIDNAEALKEKVLYYMELNTVKSITLTTE